VARVSAAVILVLGLVATFDHTTTLHRVLGSASLVLAVALVALVVGSERSRPLPDHTD
jgi:hypothetical protein